MLAMRVLNQCTGRRLGPLSIEFLVVAGNELLLAFDLAGNPIPDSHSFFAQREDTYT
jgi:hypothetical protein